jgi:hypothetical protein
MLILHRTAVREHLYALLGVDTAGINVLTDKALGNGNGQRG